MEVTPLQRPIVAADIAPERLAGNPRLTQEQKVDEASRQFESILVKQILSEAQKTVIPSEFSDDSTAAGIYQDLVTKSLADSISKSGAFGLAKTFSGQLNRHTAGSSRNGHHPSPAVAATATVRPDDISAHLGASARLRRHSISLPAKTP